MNVLQWIQIKKCFRRGGGGGSGGGGARVNEFLILRIHI